MKSHKGFDRLSGIYDLLVRIVFGRALRNAQIALIEQVGNRQDWLILGGGTGWILDEIFKVHPNAKITYLEVSEKMINRARQRVPHQKVNYVLGTINQLSSLQSYDVVMTPFFWDMFSTKEAVRMRQSLDQKLKNGTILLLADFKNTDIWWQRILMKMMYWFFRTMCHIEATELPDFDRIYHKKNMVQFQDTFYHGMIESTVYNYKV